MDKSTLVIALAAGLLGGLLSRYIAPQPAFAQNVTKEIRAQSFTIVDPADRVIGTFTTNVPFPPPGARRIPRDRTASPNRIVLRDSDGREIWSAGLILRPLSQR